jgi:hypothetical protein
MLCQKCRKKDEVYMIVKRNGKFLDAEWISRFFGTSHLDVRADRTQNWPRQIIWEMTVVQLQCHMSFRWPEGKLLYKENPKYWSQYLEILDEGISATTAGPWDAIENPVKILRWDDPNVYYGDDDDE